MFENIQRPKGKEDLMHYVGIDLHKRDMVVTVADDDGAVGEPKRMSCRDEVRIVEYFRGLRPFEAVIEASSSYRWLYDLVSPMGRVVLAHPLKLRAIVAGRAKTDKLDSAMLAKLLRLGMIPESYVPPRRFQALRELVRTRARLSGAATTAKNRLHAILAGANAHSPHKTLFSKAGRRWIAGLELGFVRNIERDELLTRLRHYDEELGRLDSLMGPMMEEFPEVTALTGLHGVGLYTALLIVAEIGEVERFPDARRVGAYAGLTARVSQSGGRNYHGHITRQGSRWLRWALVQAAMKLVRSDPKLRNFYTRIRKRSGRHVARVAAARKLAGICWVRLRTWHRRQAA